MKVKKGIGERIRTGGMMMGAHAEQRSIGGNSSSCW